MSVAAEKNSPPGCINKSLFHPARYGISKENAANGYPRILSKSLHGIANPENGPNPEVKLNPKQKYLAQLGAIVRRLILRLRFIFSVAMQKPRRFVNILFGQKKKEIHENCRPGCPARKGTAAGA